jgi:hypothetical protein
MPSAEVRAFSTGAKKALRWVGATKNDVINQNLGKDGAVVIRAI